MTARKASIADRLSHFREMVDDAKNRARRAMSPEVREAYMDLARSWEQLIAEIEQHQRPSDGDEQE